MVDVPIEKVLAAFELYDRAKGYFAPFKPDTTHVSINYKEQLCEMRLHIHVPEGKRRHIGKVEIVKNPGFRIREILDPQTCMIVNGPGFYEDSDKWKLDANELPPSEHYLVFLEGHIDSNVLNKIVRVQPSRNRDQTEEIDRYWLDSMINDTAILEKVWQKLEVQDVNVGVKVAIDRAFSGVLPFDLKEKIEATQRFLQSGKNASRDEFFKDWFAYRQASKKSTLSVDKLVTLAQKLTSADSFNNYVDVDPPYRVGGILQDESLRRKPFPEIVNVNAKTDLDFKCPMATGYLTFNKKNYVDAVRKLIDGLV